MKKYAYVVLMSSFIGFVYGVAQGNSSLSVSHLLSAPTTTLPINNIVAQPVNPHIDLENGDVTAHFPQGSRGWGDRVVQDDQYNTGFYVVIGGALQRAFQNEQHAQVYFTREMSRIRAAQH